MAEISTLARPYANAVFAAASEQKNYSAWSDALQMLTLLVENEQVSEMIHDPMQAREKICDMIFEIAGDKLDEKSKNFVRLLVENRRLDCLPEIQAQYEMLRAEAENTVEAELISAFEIDDQQKSKITESLKKRLGRDVNLSCRVDQSLVCGAVIRAGDLVIDGSMSAQLTKLASQLRQ